MKVRPVTPPDIETFTHLEATPVRLPIMLPGGSEPPGTGPNCLVAVRTDPWSVHAPWMLDEIELNDLAKGASIWVSVTMIDGLPAIALTVLKTGQQYPCHCEECIPATERQP